MLGSSYMNGTLVDSYLKRGAHIITQAPMEGTVVDFWRMVWDKKVCVIVNLLTDKEIDEVREESLVGISLRECRKFWLTF